ncbi:MAG: Crp/Fnr family transcriptional regulator [Bacteroidetes bacterium]|nr:Crp/Fnr family transcriptional regulator [Bacteroidota bacterium]
MALAQVKEFFFNLIPTMTEEKWQSFEAIATVRHYKKGDVIIKPGMVSNHVSFINKGLLRSYYLVDGKEIIVSFFDSDCYFSEYESFLSRKPSNQYADVLEDTEMVEITYDDLQNLYGKYADCERAGRLIAEQLFVELCNRNTSFMLQTPEERYHRFYEECEQIANRIPQYMIASYLGITPEALSRIRSRIRNKPTAAIPASAIDAE